MEYEWDEAKYRSNLAKHGLDFLDLEGFAWDRALIVDRTRHQDGEARFGAIGMFNHRLHTVIFTWRGNLMRIISFRPANDQEKKIYETQNH